MTAVTLGTTVAPALAAPARRPQTATTSHCPGAPLPALDPGALQQAISSSPDRVTAMLARVSGPAGHWTGTFGKADISTGAPVPADGRFRLGSVTKVFIATVVLQLAGEDRLELDHPVQDYLPGVLPTSPVITVRQLLNYTSGLPELTPDDIPTDPKGMVEHRFDDHPMAQLIAMALSHPRPYDPGQRQNYGSTGYYVAAMLVQRLTGHSYQQEITQRILRPLHLRHTTAPETDTAIHGPHAHGYLAVPQPDGTPQLADVTEQNPGAGGLISTTADLDVFLTALFRGRLLPAAQLDELFTVPAIAEPHDRAPSPNRPQIAYSAGLMRITMPNGLTVWGKTGSTFGYTDGMFATRDLRRRLIYSFNPISGGGNDAALVNKTVSAAFS
ncbi:serine hydrolase domain-containing protein [Streptomyces orinoci]|uniref:Serine hydrolase domain-containing protein n=1 Tax=Streptomyces orinoci TaxID=67339 RepID=A0ABV3JTG3_STRON|nr:serine hydrolase domain-containing protein [Streptomyces orinoci]